MPVRSRALAPRSDKEATEMSPVNVQSRTHFYGFFVGPSAGCSGYAVESRHDVFESPQSVSDICVESAAVNFDLCRALHSCGRQGLIDVRTVMTVEIGRSRGPHRHQALGRGGQHRIRAGPGDRASAIAPNAGARPMRLSVRPKAAPRTPLRTSSQATTSLPAAVDRDLRMRRLRAAQRRNPHWRGVNDAPVARGRRRASAPSGSAPPITVGHTRWTMPVASTAIAGPSSGQPLM